MINYRKFYAASHNGWYAVKEQKANETREDDPIIIEEVHYSTDADDIADYLNARDLYPGFKTTKC